MTPAPSPDLRVHTAQGIVLLNSPRAGSRGTSQLRSAPLTAVYSAVVVCSNH
jgi:hypothetical protein